MEYPVLDYKHIKYHKPVILGLLGMGIPFSLVGILFWMFDYSPLRWVFIVMFGFFGIGMTIVGVYTLLQYILTKTLGKEIIAIEYGIADKREPDKEGKLVGEMNRKFLINTNKRYRIILYPYENKDEQLIKDYVKIKTWKNNFYFESGDK